jgi:hypothetical protein
MPRTHSPGRSRMASRSNRGSCSWCHTDCSPGTRTGPRSREGAHIHARPPRPPLAHSAWMPDIRNRRRRESARSGPRSCSDSRGRKSLPCTPERRQSRRSRCTSRSLALLRTPCRPRSPRHLGIPSTASCMRRRSLPSLRGPNSSPLASNRRRSDTSCRRGACSHRTRLLSLPRRQPPRPAHQCPRCCRPCRTRRFHLPPGLHRCRFRRRRCCRRCRLGPRFRPRCRRSGHRCSPRCDRTSRCARRSPMRSCHWFPPIRCARSRQKTSRRRRRPWPETRGPGSCRGVCVPCGAPSECGRSAEITMQ